MNQHVNYAPIYANDPYLRISYKSHQVANIYSRLIHHNRQTFKLLHDDFLFFAWLPDLNVRPYFFPMAGVVQRHPLRVPVIDGRRLLTELLMVLLDDKIYFLDRTEKYEAFIDGLLFCITSMHEIQADYVVQKQKLIRERVYGMEEKFIKPAGTCLGILASDGVLLAVEERNPNSKRKTKAKTKTLEAEIYQLDGNRACGIVGSTSEAKKTVACIRQGSTRGALEHYNALGLSSNLTDSLGFPSSGYLYSKRNVDGPWEPYRIAAIFIGWNKKAGYKLTKNGEDLKIACVGNNSIEVASYLEKEYIDGQITLNDAKVLAIKALKKNSHKCELNSDSIKIATLKQVRNKPTIEIVTSEDLKTLIKTCKEKEYEEAKSVAKESPRKSNRMFPIPSSAIPSPSFLSADYDEQKQRLIEARACEYEEKFINPAGTCLGILASDGVLLAVEERNTNSKRKTKASTRILEAEIYQLDENIACGIVGNTSDAKKIMAFIHQFDNRGALEHYNALGLPFDLRNSLGYPLLSNFGPVKWTVEPCRIAAIYIGWNKKTGYKLTRNDYRGRAKDLKIACIGNNRTEVASYLEKECNDGQITLNDAKVLAIKALKKNSHECELDSDSVKIATLKQVRNKPTIEIMTSEDLKTLIETCKEKEYEETKSVAKEPPRKRQKKYK